MTFQVLRLQLDFKISSFSILVMKYDTGINDIFKDSIRSGKYCIRLFNSCLAHNIMDSYNYK